MINVVLGGIAGIGVLIYRLNINRKRKNKIQELSLGRDFSSLDYSRNVAVFIGLCTLLPIGFLIYTISKQEELLIAFSLAFTFMFIAELLSALQVMRFYYDDTCCIIGDKLLKYKSIKAVYQRKSNPFRPFLILTFNGEQYSIAKGPCQLILEKTKLSIINKPS